MGFIEQLQEGVWRVSQSSAFPCIHDNNLDISERCYVKISRNQFTRLFCWYGKLKVGDLVVFQSRGLTYKLTCTEITYLSIKFSNFYLDIETCSLEIPVHGEFFGDKIRLYPLMCKIYKNDKIKRI